MWQLAEDTLDQSDMEALAHWLTTNPQLTQGPLVSEFEKAWASWVGTRNAVMVSSGSTANLALIAALTDDRVDTPFRVGTAAVTWPTNITPGILLGHETIMIDINPHTLGVDAEVACELMEAGQIDVLFVTHLLGFNALTQSIVDTAAQNDVTLLEDCCEAHGAQFFSQRVGSVGLGATFSFYFGHHMSTVEGGMISTDDDSLADRLRMIRNHGLARSSDLFEEYAQQHPNIDPRFLFITTGMNYRSTDINAFLGLRQLKTLDERITHRNTNLDHHLESLPAWVWSDFDTTGVSSFALPLIAEDREGFEIISRVVADLGIEARPVVAGNLALQPFATDHPRVRRASDEMPVADHVHQYGLYVGNGHHVTKEKISKLANALREAR